MAGVIEHVVERIPGLDALARSSTGVIHRALYGPGRAWPVRRKIADFLHGVWLRHPLHPMLTDLTVGAWTLGLGFDLVAHVTGSRNARWAGDRLNEVGVAAAVPTAITGMTEYSSAPKPALRTATLHGLLNTVTLTLCLASIWQRRRGSHPRAYALSLSAQSIMLASAWLGGMLVYKHRVGVDHGETFAGPDDWTHVLDEYELPEQSPRRVELDGQGIVLYRDNGRVHAISAVCAHAGGPLEEGSYHDGCVTCPWHGSVYDLRTGAVVHGPSTRPQTSFDVRVHHGRIEIRLAPDAEPRTTLTGRAVLNTLP